MARVTLRDVAARAGVSRATASLVLRGTGRVSDETRQRVMDTMAELGYVYDRVAASLRTQRAPFVGVVITNITNPFFGELFKGLEAALLESGFMPLVASTSDDPKRQDEVLTMLREHQVAGLAVVPATGSDSVLLDRLTTWGIGHILMTRYLKDGHATYIGADDVRGGQLAGEHLVGHGCRKLAYIGGPVTMVSRHDRLTGLRQAAADAGLHEADVIDLPGETSGPGGLSLGRRLLELDELPDGILCHSDNVAFGLSRALHDQGMADLPVIGYDNISSAALWQPPLTTVDTHAHALGRQAAEILLQRMELPAAPSVVTWTQPELVVRRSCGCHKPS
ncbi:LacI family DNA-binding transcriptional regulator [Amycolatopsis sp. EV170708-02-1]|uniref:LacI family DNA-binding transcriptional regulator n=1 Tax=Amycolatopsis sp. EV170708-02-1 TaxID=2919322 RepID=UPI001F0C18CA|nr:LacI family DNA-binding transcriptional regulator [Amycolatopsis sp. EV170708-02-1]UMP00111.1 LacI family transcriptional regulator [Amycolatopsis sp. EV170708-02-1]